jgi:hypothetical protein
LASAAAIIRFSVAPTEGCGKRMLAPFSPSGVGVALDQLDRSAHPLEAVQMQIDRPGADRAAARQRHPGLAGAGEQRPEDQHRGPHLAHQVVRRGGVHDLGAMQHDAPRRAGKVAGFDAEDLQQPPHRCDVHQIRDVLELERLIGQQTGGHQRQRGVLGAADVDPAGKRHTTVDQKTIHRFPNAATRSTTLHSYG